MRKAAICLALILSGTVSSATMLRLPGGGPAAASCTEQWKQMARHPGGRTPNGFGQACILAGQPAPRAMTRAELMPLIAAAIPDSARLPASQPVDVGAFCPRYWDQTPGNRAFFWRELLFRMMGPESDYKPATMYWEGTEYRVGLLQMSLSNGCVSDERDLVDPAKNIACAVRRMEALVAPRTGSAGRIGGDAAHGKVGAARYWSTLRVVAQKPGGRGRETRDPIVAATKALRPCWTSPAS